MPTWGASPAIALRCPGAHPMRVAYCRAGRRAEDPPARRECGTTNRLRRPDLWRRLSGDGDRGSVACEAIGARGVQRSGSTRPRPTSPAGTPAATVPRRPLGVAASSARRLVRPSPPRSAWAPPPAPSWRSRSWPHCSEPALIRASRRWRSVRRHPRPTLQALVLAAAPASRGDLDHRTVSFLELFYDLVYWPSSLERLIT